MALSKVLVEKLCEVMVSQLGATELPEEEKKELFKLGSVGLLCGFSLPFKGMDAHCNCFLDFAIINKTKLQNLKDKKRLMLQSSNSFHTTPKKKGS